jgi:hypothetical protein
MGLAGESKCAGDRDVGMSYFPAEPIARGDARAFLLQLVQHAADLRLATLDPDFRLMIFPDAADEGESYWPIRIMLGLNLFLNDALDRSDRIFVALVHGPLLDPFGPHQFRRDQDAHVFAQRRRAQTELFRNQNATHAIVHQIAVHLLAKMPLRIAKPVQDQKAAFVGERPQRNRNFHLAILLIN